MRLDRNALRLAILFTVIHGAFAFISAETEWMYGSVGSYSMLNDVDIFYRYATRAVEGETPYRDFAVEYPILAFPFFLLPRLFVSNYTQFRLALGIEMIAADGVGLYLVARRLLRFETIDTTVRRLCWFSIALALMLPMAVCRFDLAIMTWTFAAATAWGSGSPVVGGLLGGAGTLTKIVPGVSVFPCFVRELFSRGKRWGVATCVGSFVACVVLWLAIGGSNVSKSLGYHLERGVEIGSIHASGLLVAAVARNEPVDSVYRHECLELVTPWSDAVGALGFPLQVASLSLVGWRAYRDQKSDPLRYSAAAVVAFITFGKVLSPQYLLWLLPFFACFAGRSGAEARKVFLLTCLTTSLIFPWGFHGMLQFRNWAIGLLVYRNILLLKLWYDLTFSRASWKESSPGPRTEFHRTHGRRTSGEVSNEAKLVN
jgi:hypothetical protein